MTAGCGWRRALTLAVFGCFWLFLVEAAPGARRPKAEGGKLEASGGPLAAALSSEGAGSDSWQSPAVVCRHSAAVTGHGSPVGCGLCGKWEAESRDTRGVGCRHEEPESGSRGGYPRIPPLFTVQCPDSRPGSPCGLFQWLISVCSNTTVVRAVGLHQYHATVVLLHTLMSH